MTPLQVALLPGDLRCLSGVVEDASIWDMATAYDPLFLQRLWRADSVEATEFWTEHTEVDHTLMRVMRILP